MPDEKPSIDRALELFVYAPVGMALYVRDMFPSMMGIFVSRGKREVKSHLPGGKDGPAPPIPPVPVPDINDVRRRMGDSIGLARGVAGGGLGLARDVTGSALQGFMAWRTPAPGDTSDSTAWKPEPESTSGPAAFTTPTTAPVADRAASAPSVEELPIPDYDELSASQVIERLDGLDTASLEAVRAYEAGHRGRNTILGKIAQLS